MAKVIVPMMKGNIVNINPGTCDGPLTINWPGAHWNPYIEKRRVDMQKKYKGIVPMTCQAITTVNMPITQCHHLFLPCRSACRKISFVSPSVLLYGAPHERQVCSGVFTSFTPHWVQKIGIILFFVTLFGL